MARTDVQEMLKVLESFDETPPVDRLSDVAVQLEKLVKASEAQVRLSRAESKKECVNNHDVLEKIAMEINRTPALDIQPLTDALKEVINKDKQVYKFSVERNRDGFIQTITAQPE